MKTTKLPDCGQMDGLSEVIRYTEHQVVYLQSNLEVVMAEPSDDVTEGLVAREMYVMRAGQLSGLKLAWLIMTGSEWMTEHPNLHVAERPVPEPESAIAE